MNSPVSNSPRSLNRSKEVELSQSFNLQRIYPITVDVRRRLFTNTGEKVPEFALKTIETVVHRSSSDLLLQLFVIIIIIIIYYYFIIAIITIIITIINNIMISFTLALEVREAEYHLKENFIIYAFKKFYFWENRPYVRPPLHVRKR